jgi:hypothetical protein
MPPRKQGRMMTVAVVLDRDQVAELKALQALRSSRHMPVSFSAVVRVVVAEGLAAIRRAPDTTFGSTLADSEGEAA